MADLPCITATDTAQAMLDHGLICPICQAALQIAPKVWQCTAGHCFDVAREGYVNLLPVQHKKSRSPGDTAEAVAARRAFLAAGHYQPLRDVVVAQLAQLSAQRVLDLGCGEGYYSSAMQRVSPWLMGLDIAKPAIQTAAKRYKSIHWVVGSGVLLPLASASIDVVTSLFSPLPVTEMQRVLKADGHVIVATPAPDHLWSIREALFDEVRAHEPDKFLTHLAPSFALIEQIEMRVPLQLAQADLGHLVAMTPYAWKAKADKRAALESNRSFTTEAVFRVLVLQKTAKIDIPPASVSDTRTG
jgi:23S rRNA (guanine745-N1)-methyltransferase